MPDEQVVNGRHKRRKIIPKAERYLYGIGGNGKRQKEGARASEVVTQFFDQSKTSIAPPFHWRQELRSYLEQRRIIVNGKYNGKSVVGLPTRYNYALKEALGNFPHSRRFLGDKLATPMETAGKGKSKRLVPSMLTDRVRQALYYQGHLPRKKLAEKLSLSRQNLMSAINKIPMVEREVLLREGEQYRLLLAAARRRRK